MVETVGMERRQVEGYWGDIIEKTLLYKALIRSGSSGTREPGFPSWENEWCHWYYWDNKTQGGTDSDGQRRKGYDNLIFFLFCWVVEVFEIKSQTLFSFHFYTP